MCFFSTILSKDGPIHSFLKKLWQIGFLVCQKSVLKWFFIFCQLWALNETLFDMRENVNLLLAGEGNMVELYKKCWEQWCNSWGVQGAECSLTRLTGKFLLTYREKRGKGKWRRKEGKSNKGRWKIENGRVKSYKICKPLKLFWVYQIGNFPLGKKDFASSEKYSSYTSGWEE